MYVILTLSVSFFISPASGSTFPYTGRHQQLHLLASVTKCVLPAKEPNNTITITVGKSLHGT